MRHEADMRIAETDLATLVRADPVDLEQVKVMLQEIERLHMELRFARIRAIEQGKALLSSELREKLESLLDEPLSWRLHTELR